MSSTQFNNEDLLQETAPNHDTPKNLTEEKLDVQQYSPQYQDPSSAAPQYPPPYQSPAAPQDKPQYSPQHPPQYLPQYPPQYPPQPVTQTVVRTECTTIRARPPSYMGLSIFTCLCCCWPFGLVAVVKASEVSGYVAAGNFEAANRSSEQAKNWSIAALICGIFILIGIGVVTGIQVSAAASTDPYYY